MRKIYLGCRESAHMGFINNQRTEVKKIDLKKNKFYATSFKYSKTGNLFVGNLYGDPIIYKGGEIIDIPLKTNRSYDCLWIGENNMLISCMSEGRVVFCKINADGIKMVKEFFMEQPYRFSPIQNNRFLLTTRGWVDRPGRIYMFKLQNNYNQIMPQMEKYIDISDSLFLRKKYLPTYILDLYSLPRYTAILMT